MKGQGVLAVWLWKMAGHVVVVILGQLPCRFEAFLYQVIIYETSFHLFPFLAFWWSKDRRRKCRACVLLHYAPKTGQKEGPRGNFAWAALWRLYPGRGILSNNLDCYTIAWMFPLILDPCTWVLYGYSILHMPICGYYMGMPMLNPRRCCEWWNFQDNISSWPFLEAWYVDP